MNDQQRAAMQMALETIETLWDIIDDIDTYGDMAKADEKLYRSLVERKQRERFKTGITTDGYTLNDGAITALREALAQQQDTDTIWWPSIEPKPKAQPQGEWVDLTDGDLVRLWESGDLAISFREHEETSNKAIAAFKSKNTPPVVPQCEPVAWMYELATVMNHENGEYGCWKSELSTVKPRVPMNSIRNVQQLYTIPPSVEAATEATKEKAAKVCEEMHEKFWNDNSVQLLDWGAATECAAAIRSMK